MLGAGLLLAAGVVLGGSGLSACSDDSRDGAAPSTPETAVDTEPPTSSAAPTTIVAPTTTTVATTVPPTTAAPTTTVDEATRRFNELFGGPREKPTPLPDPHRLSTQAMCTIVAGGFGVDGTVPWSDGVTETISAPGPFTVSANHVATGSRGSTIDIVIEGPSCLAHIPLV
ncbi:MAG: hypothetical protein ACXV8G_00080 [Acidimicrobiales bacterium]